MLSQSLRLVHPACLALAAATGLAGCNAQIAEYLPVSAIARGGFISDQGAEARGREVRLWGFVDQGNLYGDVEVKRILGEWWSGEGPDADHWRFDLKAQADDAVGHSFAVLVPNDGGREHLLERFVADARAPRATRVFVTGRLFRFHAPTQIPDLTGLYLRLRSSRDIRLDTPDGHQKPDGAGIGPNTSTHALPGNAYAMRSIRGAPAVTARPLAPTQARCAGRIRMRQSSLANGRAMTPA